MKEEHELERLLQTIFEKEILILATLSSPRKQIESFKVSIRPICVKEQWIYQVTEQRGQQALHRNLQKDACLSWLLKHVADYKQTYLYTKSADYHLLRGKKGHLTILEKSPSQASRKPLHNRQKRYLLEEGRQIPFLVHMGVMNSEGKVYATKRDKFRQINRFLEMIEDVLPHLDGTRTIRIVDFGCGKAYLTFALYHFLSKIKAYQIQIVGLDLKSDVIRQCQEITRALGYEKNLKFIEGDINVYDGSEGIDLMISLHACDTATDAAIEKAVRWKAKVILCVPCCQHELMSQVAQESLNPLLRHGILKERFAALATDAARAQLLEALGYQAQIIEFIDMEHTPKNLLIRAVRRLPSSENQKSALEAYMNFKHALNITPSLEQRFQRELFMSLL